MSQGLAKATPATTARIIKACKYMGKILRSVVDD
jgi:hypothetical protein